MSTATKKATFVLGPGAAGIRMTPAEYDGITRYNENYRYELVDGVVVVLPIPSEGEAGPNEVLGGMLYVYRLQHPQGAALDWTMPERYIRLRRSRRRADRVMWVGLGRMPDFGRDMPTVAVEFVSRGRRNWLRDYVEKRREYLAAGIMEYWVIDRFRRVMTVYRRAGKRTREIVVAENETYQTPLLPGFELRLAELLAVADQMEEAK